MYPEKERRRRWRKKQEKECKRLACSRRWRSQDTSGPGPGPGDTGQLLSACTCPASHCLGGGQERQLGRIPGCYSQSNIHRLTCHSDSIYWSCLSPPFGGRQKLTVFMVRSCLKGNNSPLWWDEVKRMKTLLSRAHVSSSTINFHGNFFTVYEILI